MDLQQQPAMTSDHLGAGHAILHAHGSSTDGHDAVSSYFECITACSLDDGDCVTRCVEVLREA